MTWSIQNNAPSCALNIVYFAYAQVQVPYYHINDQNNPKCQFHSQNMKLHIQLFCIVFLGYLQVTIKRIIILTYIVKVYVRKQFKLYFDLIFCRVKTSSTNFQNILVLLYISHIIHAIGRFVNMAHVCIYTYTLCLLLTIKCGCFLSFSGSSCPNYTNRV